MLPEMAPSAHHIHAAHPLNSFYVLPAWEAVGSLDWYVSAEISTGRLRKIIIVSRFDTQTLPNLLSAKNLSLFCYLYMQLPDHQKLSVITHM